MESESTSGSVARAVSSAVAIASFANRSRDAVFAFDFDFDFVCAFSDVVLVRESNSRPLGRSRTVRASPPIARRDSAREPPRSSRSLRPGTPEPNRRARWTGNRTTPGPMRRARSSDDSCCVRVRHSRRVRRGEELPRRLSELVDLRLRRRALGGVFRLVEVEQRALVRQRVKRVIRRLRGWAALLVPKHQIDPVVESRGDARALQRRAVPSQKRLGGSPRPTRQRHVAERDAVLLPRAQRQPSRVAEEIPGEGEKLDEFLDVRGGGERGLPKTRRRSGTVCPGRRICRFAIEGGARARRGATSTGRTRERCSASRKGTVPCPSRAFASRAREGRRDARG